MKNIFIKKDCLIKDALKMLDKTAEKVLLVVDDSNILLGAVTDGDIRRGILRGVEINKQVSEIYNSKPTSIKISSFSMHAAKEIMLEKKVELLPVVDDQNKVVDFVVWNNVFSDSYKFNPKISNVHMPVVLMAGGKGTRLEPFTTIFPKPLLPIGDKTVIELIIDRFLENGIKDYYLTLNYKGKMIEAYFNSIEKDYNVNYVWESEFKGTAGSLKLLEKVLPETFIVSNCDIIVDAVYSDVLKFHNKDNSDLTLISSIKHYKIPYGVVDFKDGGVVNSINEKPEQSFVISTGVYIMNKSCLKYIPETGVFDMTDLIKVLHKEGLKILTYPVNEGDYIDIGQWTEYKKAIDKIKVLAVD